MLSNINITSIITLAVVGSVAFSIFHAREVNAAATMTASPVNYQPVARVDNGIHLDLHTHVDRQHLSNLLQGMQKDRPLVQERSLRKVYEINDKKHHKLRDGLFGHYLPSFN